ncbi:MAG: glutamate-5-semialdehyde dehydrogenase [Candidatus Omnitrophica bacterium]|nr:glutamate-5-semialdehyde dehydrogenase [Candidatus Omnitrophota bacterium]
MDIAKEVTSIAKRAKSASRALSGISCEAKNKALLAMAQSLIKNSQILIRANKKDLLAAGGMRLNAAMIDRLRLTEKSIQQMSASLKAIAALKDPLGRVIRSVKRPNGLVIKKVSTPIGVVAIIYESRPNVTSDCIGLCLKSGNAVILRGGREAIHSNIAIYNLLKAQLRRYNISQDAVGIIKSVDRKAVDILLGLNELVDLVIPRGGEGLIKAVAEKSKIPVIKHYKGICHTYVDNKADLNLARKVAFNAKVQRPGVCNAMETLLVHKDIAKKFLPKMVKDLKDAGVEIRADAATRHIVKGLKKAKPEDWGREYLDLILSVKVVGGLEEAIRHIDDYGSGHSDAIITKDKKRAERFLERVDSACLFVNASTRFTDGYEFGLGAEMGISTDKLHARGPMALEELTTYKYKIFGKGQIRT